MSTNGIPYYKVKPSLGKSSSFINFFMQEYHATLTGGHASIYKTFKRLSQNIFWEAMHQDIAKYISTCKTCQQIKYLPKKPFGLSQPITLPKVVCEDISMDFMVSLPAYQGNTVMFNSY